MIYCIEAWGNASNCHLDQLYIIQKKVIKFISFTNYDISSATTFKNLEILRLNKLVYNRIGIMMYKYYNNLLPSAINDLYVYSNDVPTLPPMVIFKRKTVPKDKFPEGVIILLLLLLHVHQKG